jgi:four helix bundle protein
MHNIKELKIWNKSLVLAEKVYQVSSSFPSDERFGLISQARNAAVSISSDISEDAGRNTKGEFIQFLGIANGSSYELQTQLILAERFGFIDTNICTELLDNIDELQKMNYNLQKTLKIKSY